METWVIYSRVFWAFIDAANSWQPEGRVGRFSNPKRGTINIYPQNSTQKAYNLWYSEAVVNIQLVESLGWGYFTNKSSWNKGLKRENVENKKGAAKQCLPQSWSHIECMHPQESTKVVLDGEFRSMKAEDIL